MPVQELKSTLRELLRDVLRARFDGVQYSRFARMHGYADGYMRAMLDAGLVARTELLDLVGDERHRFIQASSASPESVSVS